MIITRTPLRISIGGGGTDLPSYYDQFGGFVISAAINKYIYITINRTFRSGYFLKYSKSEHSETIDGIEHSLIREALRHHGVEPRTEIVSIADVPAGTGLGSSGTFTVGLLHALHAMDRKRVGMDALAEEACHMEMDILQEPCGKQDPYIAAYGGITCQEYATDGAVTISHLNIDEATTRDLSEHLMLFFTGYSRSASSVLSDQKTRSEKGDADMLENLHYVKDLGQRIKACLEDGDTLRFAELMHEHWLHKKKRSDNITNTQINDLYDYARDHGALGGKLVGAGGGGFLLFYARDRLSLRDAMAAKGLQEMEFSFDFDGSVVLIRN